MIKLDMHESDIVRAMKNTTKSPIHHLASRQFKIDIRDIDIDKDGIVVWEYDFEDYISHTETDFPENRWSFNAKGFKGDRSHGKGYYDRYQKQGPVKLRKKRF